MRLTRSYTALGLQPLRTPSTDAPDRNPALYGTLLRMIVPMINHCDWCRDPLRQPKQVSEFLKWAAFNFFLVPTPDCLNSHNPWWLLASKNLF